MFICKFVCPDKTFYWGPFKSKELADRYLREAKDQALEYYGKDITSSRAVIELAEPIPFEELHLSAEGR